MFVPQALSWVLRVASIYYFLLAFRVHASIHNALLALVVDSLATLFPATPGGAGTKQGLIVFLFHGRGDPASLLLAFSVGMNIAVVVVQPRSSAALSMYLMARTLSWRRLQAARGRRRPSGEPTRLGAVPYASVYPLLTTRALTRPFSYEVGDGVPRARSSTMRFGRRRTRGIVAALEERPAGRDRGGSGRRRRRAASRRRSSTSRSGSPTTTARRPRARSRSSRRSSPSAAALRAPPGERHSLRRRGEPAAAAPEQRAATERIVAALDAGGGRGVPALRADRLGEDRGLPAARARPRSSAGSATILLVPEIALAPQSVGRVRARFGDGVAILHSGLTDAERRDERDADRQRRGADRRRCALGGVRAAAAARA